MQRPKTHIALVVDASSSIDSYRLTGKILDLINTDLQMAQDMSSTQDITFTLVIFSNNAYIARDNKGRLIQGVDPKTLGPIDKVTYCPNGMTALFDGWKLGAETLMSLPGSDDPTTSYLIKTLTDGEENNSNFKGRAIALLKDRNGYECWTSVFLLPKGAKARFCAGYSVDEGNVAEWEQTQAGAEKAVQVSTQGMSMYLTARTQGVRGTKNYFEVNANDLTQKLVKKELKNVAADFRLFAIDGAWADRNALTHDKIPIKEYVESCMGGSYIKGSTYYLLEKKEKIQDYKKVVLRPKGKVEIYAGDQARELLGIAPGQTVDVVPGNFGKWDIFVQSTSSNRNLRAGSVILVDTTVVPNSTPSTWDDTQVQKCGKGHALARHPDAAKRVTHLWCKFCKKAVARAAKVVL